MRRFLFSSAIIIGALVAVGCEGDGGDATATAPTATASPTATATPTSTPAPATSRFAPGKADALAHASMVKATDLPGAGWTVASTDDFSDNDPSADSPYTAASCAPVEIARKAFDTSLNANRAGRAEIELSKEGADDPLATTADFLVYIYQDSRASAVPLGAYRGFLDSDAFMKCLQDETGSTADATVKVTKASPAASAPNGGLAAAFEMAVTTGSVTLVLRIESYAWQNSNVFAGVNLFGSKNVLTADVATAAVAKLQAALEAAASAR